MEQIYTLLISTLPIIELKGAIPLAITEYHLPWWQAYIFGVSGSMISVIIILLLLEPVQKWLCRHWLIFKKIFAWLFEYARNRHANKLKIYKEFALVLLAAFPIPVLGGAWTAALVAFVFGMPFWKSFLLILTGTLIAGGIFTLSTMGIISL